MIEQIALVITGVIAPFVINLFKGAAQGKVAFALSVFVSFTLALGVKTFLSPALGGLDTPIDPLAAMGEVFAIATLVYKAFLSKAQ